MTSSPLYSAADCVARRLLESLVALDQRFARLPTPWRTGSPFATYRRPCMMGTTRSRGA